MIELMNQVGCVSKGKTEWSVTLDYKVEGGVDVAVLQHDVDERSEMMVVGKAANGRYLGQEIGGHGSGNLLRLFEEEVPVAARYAVYFFEGHFQGSAGLVGVHSGLDAGDAHPGGCANGRRGQFGLLPRVCNMVAGHGDSLALED
jgi:hypothetical protein